MFSDRTTAGIQLAAQLRQFIGKDTVVLALPRGGVVLGAEVAKALHVPLGVVLVRKIGHPGAPEFALGAVTEDAPPLYDSDDLAAINKKWLARTEAKARQVLAERHTLYYDKNKLQPLKLTHKIVIIVDDGIATGLTMRAAIRAAQHHNPKRIIVAVPVASAEALLELEHDATCITLTDPADFAGAVGAHYATFNQVSDQEVAQLLHNTNMEVQP